MNKEQNAQEENKTFLVGITIVTVLEVVVWLFFYWIHLKIRA
jgi:hypothetical protein